MMTTTYWKESTMQIHPRYFIVQKAKHEISMAITRVMTKNDISLVEGIGILGDEILSLQKHALRVERHGTADKKADEA